MNHNGKILRNIIALFGVVLLLVGCSSAPKVELPGTWIMNTEQDKGQNILITDTTFEYSGSYGGTEKELYHIVSEKNNGNQYEIELIVDSDEMYFVFPEKNLALVFYRSSSSEKYSLVGILSKEKIDFSDAKEKYKDIIV